MADWQKAWEQQPAMMKIYKERDGGRWAYWAYSSDGQRVYVSEAFALRETSRGAARLVLVGAG